MRILAAILLLAIIGTCKAQGKRKNFWLKQSASFGFAFAAGAARGVNEVITHNYDQFESKHPNANDDFWNPKISWRNKYKDGTPESGAAFPLSTTVLVGLTDGYHVTNSIAIISSTVSMGFTLSLYEKPNFKEILLQIAITATGFTLGKGAAHWYYRK